MSGSDTTMTRDLLSEMFDKLEAELTRLESEGQPEEALWAAFEQRIHVPAVVIDPRDRAWWWEQVYSAMERHHLTELSRAWEEGTGP